MNSDNLQQSKISKAVKNTLYSQNSPKRSAELPSNKAVVNLKAADLTILEYIKQKALNKFNVKKSRRPYVKKVLDYAFHELLVLKQKESIEIAEIENNFLNGNSDRDPKGIFPTNEDGSYSIPSDDQELNEAGQSTNNENK